jgi:hypothetical protein
LDTEELQEQAVENYNELKQMKFEGVNENDKVKITNNITALESYDSKLDLRRTLLYLPKKYFINFYASILGMTSKKTYTNNPTEDAIVFGIVDSLDDVESISNINQNGVYVGFWVDHVMFLYVEFDNEIVVFDDVLNEPLGRSLSNQLFVLYEQNKLVSHSNYYSYFNNDTRIKLPIIFKADNSKILGIIQNIYTNGYENDLVIVGLFKGGLCNCFKFILFIIVVVIIITVVVLLEKYYFSKNS